MKCCVTCRQEKAVSEFNRDRNRPDGLKPRCRDCGNRMGRETYARHIDTRRASKRVAAKAKYDADPVKAKSDRREYVRSLRQEMLDAYGRKCECCGEGRWEFLTLEHKMRDGAEHRRRLKSNVAILLELKKLGWPKDRYGLLCFNCNHATKNGDICPHKREAA